MLEAAMHVVWSWHSLYKEQMVMIDSRVKTY